MSFLSVLNALERISTCSEEEYPDAVFSIMVWHCFKRSGGTISPRHCLCIMSKLMIFASRKRLPVSLWKSVHLPWPYHIITFIPGQIFRHIHWYITIYWFACHFFSKCSLNSCTHFFIIFQRMLKKIDLR